MGFLDWFTPKRTGNARPAEKAASVQLVGNLQSAPATYPGTDLPSVYGPEGYRQAGQERALNSLMLTAACRVVERELQSAVVTGVDQYRGSRGRVALDATYPWAEIVGELGRRRFLDGGFHLWFDDTGPRAAPGMRVTGGLYLAIFTPDELQLDVGREQQNWLQQAGGQPPAIAYKYGSRIIPSRELATYMTRETPRRLDKLLAGDIRVEQRELAAQLNNSQLSGQSLLVIELDNQARTSAKTQQKTQPTKIDNLAPGDAPARDPQGDLIAAKVIEGPAAVMYKGERVYSVNHQVNSQWSHVIDQSAARFSAITGIGAALLGSKATLTLSNMLVQVSQLYEGIVLPYARVIETAIRQQGAFPEFTIDFSEHRAAIQTLKERALADDARALAVERRARAAELLVRVGVSSDEALQIMGFDEGQPAWRPYDADARRADPAVTASVRQMKTPGQLASEGLDSLAKSAEAAAAEGQHVDLEDLDRILQQSVGNGYLEAARRGLGI